MMFSGCINYYKRRGFCTDFLERCQRFGYTSMFFRRFQSLHEGTPFVGFLFASLVKETFQQCFFLVETLYLGLSKKLTCIWKGNKMKMTELFPWKSTPFTLMDLFSRAMAKLLSFIWENHKAYLPCQSDSPETRLCFRLVCPLLTSKYSCYLPCTWGRIAKF